eukprot:scaffold202222_cov34-Prasinocladus_malaysianus.AAC.1
MKPTYACRWPSHKFMSICSDCYHPSYPRRLTSPLDSARIKWTAILVAQVFVVHCADPKCPQTFLVANPKKTHFTAHRPMKTTTDTGQGQHAVPRQSRPSPSKP